MGEQRERALRRECVDVGVDFLGVEENAGEGGREVEWGVSVVVCAADESVRECRGGECGGEEGFIIDIGCVLFFCSHRDELRMRSALAIEGGLSLRGQSRNCAPYCVQR